MDQNTEMLDFIYKNTEMGLSTLDRLVGIAEDDHFKVALLTQKEEYHKIFAEAKQLAGVELEKTGAMAKFSAYMMLELKTLADNSPSHIAEMLIQGSTMGVVDMTKRLKEYTLSLIHIWWSCCGGRTAAISAVPSTASRPSKRP